MLIESFIFENSAGLAIVRAHGSAPPMRYGCRAQPRREDDGVVDAISLEHSEAPTINIYASPSNHTLKVMPFVDAHFAYAADFAPMPSFAPPMRAAAAARRRIGLLYKCFSLLGCNAIFVPLSGHAAIGFYCNVISKLINMPLRRQRLLAMIPNAWRR